MATYTKETALYDTGAIAEGIQDASETASNYLTDITGGGVYVHAADTPSEPSSATAKGVKITDQVDIIRNGDVVASYGDVVTIGQTNKTRAEIDTTSLKLIDRDRHTYFIAKDLRDDDGICRDKRASFISDGNTRSYYLSPNALNTDYTIQVSDPDWSGSVESKAVGYFVLSVAPAKNTYIYVTYACQGQDLKIYTLGERSNSSGYKTYGALSVAEGSLTNAAGFASHAEGAYSRAIGSSSHAEGNSNSAIGSSSHAEGNSCDAWGTYSHAEGNDTSAEGNYSHTQGEGTITSRRSQTALGTYNVEDTSTNTTHPSGLTNYGKYAVIVGNGNADDSRSNALTVDWDGSVATKGGINCLKPIYTNGKKILTYVTWDIDNISIAKNGVSGEKTKDISNAGYYAVGILDSWIDNATSSGTNCSWCNMYYCFVNPSTNIVTCNIKNFNTSNAAKVQAHFRILYIANEQGLW